MTSRLIPPSLRCLAILPVVAILTAATDAHASGPEPIQKESCCRRCEPRPQDEVWLVNTRSLGCPTDQEPSLELARFDAADKKWVAASLGELQSAPAMPLVVYVHGNRVEEWEALSLGWDAYCGIACHAGGEPFRFVIWSWPSEQIKGPLRDVRAKASRSDSEAWHLGWFLNQLPPETPIGLFGFSYGARIITGSLDALGGGTVAGRSLDLVAKQPDGKPMRSIRAVLQSPALDACWLCPGGCQDRAADASVRLLVLYNPCDSALKRFRFTDKCSQPEALGYTGLPCVVVLSSGQPAEEYNASGHVGREHSSYGYLHSSILMEMTREVVLP